MGSGGGDGGTLDPGRAALALGTLGASEALNAGVDELTRKPKRQMEAAATEQLQAQNAILAEQKVSDARVSASELRDKNRLKQRSASLVNGGGRSTLSSPLGLPAGQSYSGKTLLGT